MNSVIGFSELLLGDDLPEHQREYVTTIKNSGESLLSILNDILDITKIESGRLELEEIEFDVAEVVESITELMGAGARAGVGDLYFAKPSI